MTQTTNVMLEVLVTVVADGVDIPPGKYHGELTKPTASGFGAKPQQLPWEYRLSNELYGGVVVTGYVGKEIKVL